MSLLVNTGGYLTVHVRTDNRTFDDEFEGFDEFQPPCMCDLFATDDLFFGTSNFRTAWWPRGGPSGCLNDTGLGDIPSPVRYQYPYPVSGSNGRLGFNGISRDQYGSPLPGCTVRLFRTSTDELVAKVISDPNNATYIVSTPYNDAHYMTVHKSGSPNLAGASVDTLIPG